MIKYQNIKIFFQLQGVSTNSLTLSFKLFQTSINKKRTEVKENWRNIASKDAIKYLANNFNFLNPHISLKTGSPNGRNYT